MKSVLGSVKAQNGMALTGASRWLLIDPLGGRQRILPGIRRIPQDVHELRPAARDDVAADPDLQQRRIDLVVVGVGVGRLIVEDHQQVEVAVRTGASFGAAAEEVDAEGMEGVRQALNDGLEGFMLR